MSAKDYVIAPSILSANFAKLGEEVANVGTIRINFATGGAVEVDGVYCYRVSTDGKLGGIRAYWEADRIRSVD